MILTLHYRLKDNSKNLLCLMANSVNYVWNYCNAANYKQIKYYSKWLNRYELQTLTSNYNKELKLND